MKITATELGIINLVIQIDGEGKPRQFALAELSTASSIFKAIKTSVKEDKFVDGDVKLSSEEKVFLTKLIDERTWTVGDSDAIFDLKKLLK